MSVRTRSTYPAVLLIACSALLLALVTLPSCGVSTHPSTMSYPHAVLLIPPPGTKGGAASTHRVSTREDGVVVWVEQRLPHAEGDPDEATDERLANLTTTTLVEGEAPKESKSQAPIKTVTKTWRTPEVRTIELCPDGTVRTTIEPGRIRGTRTRVFPEGYPSVALGEAFRTETTLGGETLTTETRIDGTVVTTRTGSTVIESIPDGRGGYETTVNAPETVIITRPPERGSHTAADGSTYAVSVEGKGAERKLVVSVTTPSRPSARHDGSTRINRLLELPTYKLEVPLAEPTDEPKVGKAEVHGLEVVEKTTISGSGTVTVVREATSGKIDAAPDAHVGFASITGQIDGSLQMYFGTPTAPFVLGYGDDIERKALAIGRDQFRVNCVHCHGMWGAGDGPTAPFLNPRPRDFRRGVFKFRSTPVGTKPTHADLVRIIKRGAHGTMMPAFDRPWDVDVDALAWYVQYLSMRGELEGLLFNTYLQNEMLEPDDVSGNFEYVTEAWMDGAPDAVVEVGAAVDISTPELLAASIKRGGDLFRDGKTGNCLSCHGPNGAGDGDDTSSFVDDWGYPLPPANLTKGQFRGGSRPIDLYMRIASGISGTKMPGYAGSLVLYVCAEHGTKNAKPECSAEDCEEDIEESKSYEQIWDLVNFVKSLPREAAR